MGKEYDRIGNDIGCIDTANIAATLIDTNGFHCDVWRSIGTLIQDGQRQPLDFVIKVYRQRCTVSEIAMYRRHYDWLKEKLGDIIPTALFVATKIDGRPSALVLAETARPWFNLANPVNESDLVPLLSRLPQARHQLRQFLDAASEWQNEPTTRIIDLYGNDNLILDSNYQIKYIDSFEVFFLADMLELFAGDKEFSRRIQLAKQRHDYLRHVWHAAEAKASTGDPK